MNAGVFRLDAPFLRHDHNKKQVNLTLNSKNIWVMKRNSNEQKSGRQEATPFAQTYFHGTKADLKIGDFIEAGYNSNFGRQRTAKYVFLSATLDAAIWGAELAIGAGRERIYVVEPTGAIEDTLI
jgi:rifampin ADP-ribosylating transferase